MEHLERDDGTKMPVGTHTPVGLRDNEAESTEEATVSPRTRIWVAIDFAADGPAAMVFAEDLLSQDASIVGWHVINPANEADKAEFKKVGDDLARVFEDEGPMEEMPFEEESGEEPADLTRIGEHLVSMHGYPYTKWFVSKCSHEGLVKRHNQDHEDPDAEAEFNHSHEHLQPEDF